MIIKTMEKASSTIKSIVTLYENGITYPGDGSTYVKHASIEIDICIDAIKEALVDLYVDFPLAVAELCDNYLDESGELLGWVRIKASEVKNVGG